MDHIVSQSSPRFFLALLTAILVQSSPALLVLSTPDAVRVRLPFYFPDSPTLTKHLDPSYLVLLPKTPQDGHGRTRRDGHADLRRSARDGRRAAAARVERGWGYEGGDEAGWRV